MTGPHNPPEWLQQVSGRFVITCEEHGLTRVVETGAHARNLFNLHMRKDHDDDTQIVAVDLTAAAWAVVDAREPITKGGDPYDRGYTNGALGIWQSLTGIEDDAAALAYAQELAAAVPPITAAIPPF